MKDLTILDSYDEQISLLEQHIKRLYDGKTELTILEAGCGRRWPLDLGLTKYRLIGVDLDKAALDIRVNVVRDLHEAIVADLQDFDLGDRQFDVVYSAFVLEHAQDAERVMENMFRALKVGGLFVLQFPDRDTVFGLITRATPLWFHVLYKKYVEGQKEAGKPGFGPYPTYYNKIVSRKGMREFSRARGLAIKEEIGSNAYLYKKSLKTSVVRMLSMAMSAASLGTLPWRYNNLTYVLQKK